MDSNTLPEHVRSFLLAHIESYEQLEVLLSLHAEPTRRWSTAELIRELGIGEEPTLTALDHLQRSGLVHSEQGRFYFRPSTPSLGSAVDDLAHVYTSSRVSVVELMTSHSIERLRTAAIRRFAEAFRVTGRKKDG